ncbi:GntR family transcriptional regulator [Paeniglutamicibacter sp. NPDC012692]|uniref:GntR family transcriptional regulator n=1 Tax=Paeniglutamicibacter sp. NPDC012692 TaxID=3364388 RepID=UPI0036CD0030
MRTTSRTTSSGREKAYSYLRENILIDPEMQGKFLNEQELAAEIGVSRTPVREALLLLVSDGLVELIPQRGAYVPVVTGREISELMDVRGVLECHAAQFVIAKNAVPLEAMQETLDLQASMPDHLTPDAAREFIRLDTLFHQQLIDAVDNELLSRSYSKLHVRQILVGVSALSRTGGRREQVCAEHQDILDALASGDTAKANEAIGHHLAVTRDILLRT